MAEGSVGIIVIGTAMLLLSKVFTKLHMRLLYLLEKSWPSWFRNFVKAGKYEKIFFYMWIILAIFMIIVNAISLF
ncbi:hypothetical protein GF336_06485 [Candidatus Woesearchaeota archaeon]|nr:hypothetical protein [Candidatus Woesearchaeota archaeon]